MGTCYDRYTRQYYTCNSGWSNWGRWVLFGVLILVALVFFFLISCFTARRRRKAGRTPMYGTGWAANGPRPQTETQYQQPQYNQSAPAYNNTGSNNTGANGGYYGQNQAYFGGQQTGNEMQAPANAYRTEANYAPPAGPPPSKY